MVNNKHANDFAKLESFLRRQGFILRRQKGNCAYTVEGYGVFAAFALPDDNVAPLLKGRLVADNARCFDKWSKCPLSVPLDYPQDELLRHLKHLGGPEGYQISNDYAYLDDNPYPYTRPDCFND